MDAASTTETLRIRKYPNRRYYDVTNSRHVTLAELYERVRAGARISVEDSRTGDDITSAVLTQILLEHASEKLEIFPAQLLHQAIQANQQMLASFVKDYFAKALDAFAQSRQQFDRFLSQAGLSPLTATTPLDWAQMLFKGMTQAAAPTTSAAKPPEHDATPPAKADDRDRTLAEMHDRIEQLSRELNNLQKKQSRKPKTKPANRKPSAKKSKKR